ncbi:MAG: methionyl-tRNA formyltransferase [Candidatus Dojkabacteria bacterium]
MKIAFYGSSPFSLEILKTLYDNHKEQSLELAYVVTQPAKPVGRKKVITPNPVEVFCQEHSIICCTPHKLKELFTPEELANPHSQLRTDMAIVAAYGKILPGKVLDTAKHGFINFHGSILPNYRGATPVQTTILNQDPTAGITIIKMDEGMDTGDIILTKEIPIPANSTSGELMQELALLSAQLLRDEFTTIMQPENWKLQPQNHESATYTDLSLWKDKKNFEIHYLEGLGEAHGKIMAANPDPKACVTIKSGCKTSKYNLIRSRRTDTSNDELHLSNQISLHSSSDKRHLYLELSEGFLEILEIQPEGKQIMDAKSFINGYVR